MRTLALLALVLSISACSVAPPAGGGYDPFYCPPAYNGCFGGP